MKTHELRLELEEYIEAEELKTMSLNDLTHFTDKAFLKRFEMTEDEFYESVRKIQEQLREELK